MLEECYGPVRVWRPSVTTPAPRLVDCLLTVVKKLIGDLCAIAGQEHIMGPVFVTIPRSCIIGAAGTYCIAGITSFKVSMIGLRLEFVQVSSQKSWKTGLFHAFWKPTNTITLIFMTKSLLLLNLLLVP